VIFPNFFFDSIIVNDPKCRVSHPYGDGAGGGRPSFEPDLKRGLAAQGLEAAILDPSSVAVDARGRVVGSRAVACTALMVG
jgi:hypothetical protein